MKRRDESCIIIGGIPLDIYDAQIARQKRQKGLRVTREGLLWALAWLALFGMLSPALTLISSGVGR